MSSTTAIQQRKAPPQSGDVAERAFTLKREAVNLEQRTVELAFASEQPYERWWGVEVLDCSAPAVRLARLTSSGPALVGHDTRDLVGVVESVTVGADRVCRALVRFGRSARAEEILNDVADGIRRNVSVGYVIHKAVLVEKSDDGTADIYRVTDWEPYEVSFVPVPADYSVGVGRAMPPASLTTPITQAIATEERQAMTAATTTTEQPPALQQPAAPAAPALNLSQTVADAVVAERGRHAELDAIAGQFAKYGAAEIVKRAKESGASVEDVRKAVMNAMTAAQTTQVTDLGMSQREQQRFSVFRAVRALANKDWRGAEFEREASDAILKRLGVDSAVHGGFYLPADIQRRDLTVGTATAGGHLVGTTNTSFIEMLRARSVVMSMGATMLSGLVGNVTVPKQTGAATAYWLANEATAITESQQTLGQLALTPKTLGAYTELSRLLMVQSSPSAEQMVMNDFARVMALAIDLGALEGSGASGQPTGISATAGIGAVTGTTLGLAGVMEFQSDVATGNALTTNCGYVTTPAVASLLAQRQRFASTDTPLWRGNLLEGTVEGYKAMTTTQVTAASMVFGDFGQVVIGEWGMFEIALNPYANFTAAITGIRAIQSLDVGVRQAAAFSRATSIT